jgi:hypothetical protein
MFWYLWKEMLRVVAGVTMIGRMRLSQSYYEEAREKDSHKGKHIFSIA